jgi:hypothetical protein
LTAIHLDSVVCGIFYFAQHLDCTVFERRLSCEPRAKFGIIQYFGNLCNCLPFPPTQSSTTESYTLNAKHNFEPLNPTLLDSFKCVHTPQLLDPVRAFQFVFPSNKLVITNIDIQSVEPVDQRTREALSASVQQAIEITTKSQEAAARHDAERKAQEAEGLLERQKLKDEIEVLLSPNF